MTDAPVVERKKLRTPTTSGKRVILILLVLLAMWGGVLSILVWRTAKTPHYTRVPGSADQGARPSAPSR